MTSILTLNEKEYVPATIAGTQFGYTKEYLLMLIKQGKIEGQKIDNKWYVHPASAENYFITAKTKRVKQLSALSELRKSELRASEHVHDVVSSKTRTASSFSRHAQVALLETLVVVFLGISVGSLGYLGVTNSSANVSFGEQGFFKNLALSFFHLFSNETRTEEIRLAHVSDGAIPKDTMETVSISAQLGTTTHTSLVVAPDEVFTATTVQSIQDSFSDGVNVSVDPKNPKTGIITPQFKNGDGEQYRFLMVPMSVGSNTSPQ